MGILGNIKKKNRSFFVSLLIMMIIAIIPLTFIFIHMSKYNIDSILVLDTLYDKGHRIFDFDVKDAKVYELKVIENQNIVILGIEKDGYLFCVDMKIDMDEYRNLDLNDIRTISLSTLKLSETANYKEEYKIIDDIIKNSNNISVGINKTYAYKYYNKGTMISKSKFLSDIWIGFLLVGVGLVLVTKKYFKNTYSPIESEEVSNLVDIHGAGEAERFLKLADEEMNKQDVLYSNNKIVITSNFLVSNDDIVILLDDIIEVNKLVLTIKNLFGLKYYYLCVRLKNKNCELFDLGEPLIAETMQKLSSIRKNIIIKDVVETSTTTSRYGRTFQDHLDDIRKNRI